MPRSSHRVISGVATKFELVNGWSIPKQGDLDVLRQGPLICQAKIVVPEKHEGLLGLLWKAGKVVSVLGGIGAAITILVTIVVVLLGI